MAYDGNGFRETLSERGTKPVIPNHPTRKQLFSFNKRLYRLRWRIEGAFNRLKDFRRVATRYDKLAWIAWTVLAQERCYEARIPKAAA